MALSIDTQDIGFIRELSQILKKISKENKQIVITGDFNYDLLRHNENIDVNNFITLMYENLCQPYISKPTRIVKNQKPTLIDNIFVNTIESPICGNLIEKISDHLPNFIIIENQDIKKEAAMNLYQRDTSNYNPIKFQNELIDNFSSKYNTLLSADELSSNITSTFL